MITQFGNWLFHYRNIMFPAFYTALFIPSAHIFPDCKWSIIIGLFIICIGVLIRSITIGLVYIIRGGKKRQIHAETLVTDGIYKVCRNPMYLGNILLILGFGVFANSLIFLLIFFPIFFVFYKAIIRAEEEFLSRKFGVQFENYKTSSNSLIPKISQIKPAFSGHHFNFRKVISKEHNSWFLYLLGILMLLWYRYSINATLSILLFSILLLAYLYVKRLKRANRLS